MNRPVKAWEFLTLSVGLILVVIAGLWGTSDRIDAIEARLALQPAVVGMGADLAPTPILVPATLTLSPTSTPDAGEEGVREPVATEAMAAAEVASSSSGSVSAAALRPADVLALLSSTSWPEAMHPWVLAIATCESGLEPGQARGDGGLAWGLLSIRVDVHPHLAARFDLLDARDNLEAGWVVYIEREAAGLRGEDAWATCNRRAA